MYGLSTHQVLAYRPRSCQAKKCKFQACQGAKASEHMNTGPLLMEQCGFARPLEQVPRFGTATGERKRIPRTGVNQTFQRGRGPDVGNIWAQLNNAAICQVITCLQ